MRLETGYHRLDITSIFKSRGPSRPRRTEAGIMFADMAGFSALMQADERAALEARSAYRSALERAVDAAGGVVVQHYGDGSLSIFRGARDAVDAAREIQRRLRRGPSSVDVRIGVHFDAIVRDGEGVYGHGVNVAARIQSLCVPGAVLLSDRVALEVRRESDLATNPMGTFQLKNIGEPALIHALDDSALALPSPGQLRSTSAVLIAPPGATARQDRPRSTLAHLLWEVKRRRVHRVALGYCASALFLIALLELITVAASLPSSVMDAARVAALAGFLPALVLGWVFDLAPGWLVVTPPGPGLTRRRTRSGPRATAEPPPHRSPSTNPG